MLEVGVDIVEIGRIARQIRNRRFLSRVFTPAEIAYCRSKRKAAQHFAVRFAAKEAVWKALGQPGLGHRDIHVQNDRTGKPRVALSGPLKKMQRRLSVSLSHGQAYAVAVALAQR